MLKLLTRPLLFRAGRRKRRPQRVFLLEKWACSTAITSTWKKLHRKSAFLSFNESTSHKNPIKWHQERRREGLILMDLTVFFVANVFPDSS